jgi:hypothetical protein
MKAPFTARALLVLFIAALGCAALSGEPKQREATSAACTEVLRDPALLLELANAAIAEQDLELAYRYVALIHTLHPESEQSREVFPLAARLFKKNYMRHRTELDSIWVTSEPRFIIAWLARFFRDGGEFPQQQVDALFLGLNYGLFRDFLAYAESHPRLSRWAVSAKDDNGIVYEITAVPADLRGS